MSDPFGFGNVPLAGESCKEKNVCAFCESEMTVSSKFLKISEDNRIGDVPVVLTEVKHPETNYVCLEHWRQNKEQFEKLYGRDSYEGNPSRRDASVEIAQRCALDKQGEMDPDKTIALDDKAQDVESAGDATIDDVDPVERIAELQRDALKLATAALPPGMFIGLGAASSAINGGSDGTGLDFNNLSPLFLRFLAWQRLNQINQQIQMLNTGMTSEQKSAVAEMNAEILKSKKTVHKSETRHRRGKAVSMDDVKSSFDLRKTASEPEKKRARTEEKAAEVKPAVKDSTEMVDDDVSGIKPETARSKPNAAVIKPDSTGSKPNVAGNKPDAAANKQDVAVNKPEVPVIKPEVKPDAAVSKPAEKTESEKPSKSESIENTMQSEDASNADKDSKTIQEQVKRIMDDPLRMQYFLDNVRQGDIPYARLISFSNRITIAVLDKQPLICGRERSGDTDCNFLEIGDLTLHKRAVSRKHFVITYDSDIRMFFIEVFSRNGVILNGQDLRDGRHPLQSGASISVQHFTMFFVIPSKFNPPSTFYASKK